MNPTTTNTRSIRFAGKIGKADLEKFFDHVPDNATIRVTRDAGGRTPNDPGGTVTITAEWADDEGENDERR